MRFREKFRRSSTRTTVQEATPRPPATSILATADANAVLSNLQERLWNRAYDELKVSEPKVVDVYERIVSLLASGSLEPTENGNGNPSDTRCRQMQQLVRSGLDRTRKEATLKRGLEDCLQVMQKLHELVEKALRAAPQAAIAWIGVSIGLEILTNPASEVHTNRNGISYVISRMDWYWNLVRLLLDEGNGDDTSAALQNELENNIVKLYQKLLLYQVKSVCLYHRNRLLSFGRDIFKIDDWAGQLNDIKHSESIVRSNIEQYSSEKMKVYLGKLVGGVHSQETKLQSICTAMQHQAQQHQDEKNQQCLKDLRASDPRDDKKRIQGSKGGLLRDSYSWILSHPQYLQFRDDVQMKHLWIRGDPGKGKTMLLCGIIDELEKDPETLLCYFFCQATEAQQNTAEHVLRGLIFLLLQRRPPLISYLRAKYDIAGSNLFQDLNAWVSLTEILTNMLREPFLERVVMVVDALDECTTNLYRLLDFIVQSASETCPVKWIISSRNWPEIEERLDMARHKIGLHLELNEGSISDAVNAYIQHKVSELKVYKTYDREMTDAVQCYLSDNANSTFLWVALVCQELANPRVRRRHTLLKLKSFPPGLDSLYGRMMEQICLSDDANIYTDVLATISLVYRPITLEELLVLTKSLEGFNTDEAQEIVSTCGAFLSIQQGAVYFVHQSAQDYLLHRASHKILPHGATHQHQIIFLRSLEFLSKTLKRNIYNISVPGISIDQIMRPNPDPLQPVRYSTIYWVEHLLDSNHTVRVTRNSQIDRFVYEFLQRKYLYWLESLSLLQCVAEGALAMQKLDTFVKSNEMPNLSELVQDAHRFLLSHTRSIEIAPLQIYASALLFSPARSLIKQLFKKEEADWITLTPSMDDAWEACLQTLEGHSDAIYSVRFSHDSTLIASGSFDKTIRIWRADSGKFIRSLIAHGDLVRAVRFSHDSRFLVSGSDDNTVRIWEVDSGECISTLKGHSGTVYAVALSHDSRLILSGSSDRTIRIWHVASGDNTLTLNGHSDVVFSVVFSHDSKLLASGSFDNTIRVWMADSGDCIQILKGHSGWVWTVTFSHDSTLIASGSEDKTIRIWETTSGKCTRILEGYGRGVSSVSFSCDSALIISGSDDKTIRIWRLDSSECIWTVKGHNRAVRSISASHDSTIIASASYDQTIRIWCPVPVEHVQPSNGHSDQVNQVTLSHDLALIASASHDKSIRIWRVDSGECVHVLQGHNHFVRSIAFSHDSRLLVSASSDRTVRIWQADSWEQTKSLRGHSHWVWSAIFSSDSLLIASASCDDTVKIWRSQSGKCIHTLRGHSGWVPSVAFSDDSRFIASGSYDNDVRLWQTDSGDCVWVLRGHNGWISSVAFSHDSTRIASASYDKSIRIWRSDSGECIRFVDIRFISFSLNFDHDTARLVTRMGTITLPPRPHNCTVISSPDAEAAVLYSGHGISANTSWVTWYGNNVLWLPTEFRPVSSAVSGSTVIIGCYSGKVMFLRFSPSQMRSV